MVREMLTDQRDRLSYRILTAFIVLFAIIPDIGVKFTTLGFTWTALRLTMGFGLFWFLATRRYSVQIRLTALSDQWMIFLLCWFLYGAVQLVLCRYSNTHNGVIELLAIWNGVMVFALFKALVTTEAARKFVVNLLLILLVLLLLVGAFEILTGLHLPWSGYNDIGSTINKLPNKHLATGFMYNTNDYSALITCLSAVLLEKRFGIMRFGLLAAVIGINFINDANLCNLAVFSFILLYGIFLPHVDYKREVSVKVVFIIILCCGVFAAVVFGFLSRGKMVQALNLQLQRASAGQGSLFKRINMYRDAVTAWLKEGLLGFGPSSFAQYFTKNPSKSGIVNPHSLIIEIMFQYGIPILFGYLYMFVKTIGRLMKRLRYESYLPNREKYIMCLAFMLLYFVSSFAPSSFLGYIYPWLMIALVSSYLDNSLA